MAYEAYSKCADITHHIKGSGRHQVTLFPEALDDFVTENNPVRVIDIFVDGLQLTSLNNWS